MSLLTTLGILVRVQDLILLDVLPYRVTIPKSPSVLSVGNPAMSLLNYSYTLPQKKRNFSRSSIPVTHGSGSVTQGQFLL